MDNNKAPKPHFNFMWIYLGIALLLGFLVIRSGGPSLLSSSNKEVTYSEFKTYVSKGYASRIVANKRDGSLCMYVSPEHVRDVFPTSSVQPGTEVFVEAEFPSADKLDSFLDQQQEAGNFKGEVSYEQGDDMFRNILWSFGPSCLSSSSGCSCCAELAAEEAAVAPWASSMWARAVPNWWRKTSVPRLHSRMWPDWQAPSRRCMR